MNEKPWVHSSGIPRKVIPAENLSSFGIRAKVYSNGNMCINWYSHRIFALLDSLLWNLYQNPLVLEQYSAAIKKMQFYQTLNESFNSVFVLLYCECFIHLINKTHPWVFFFFSVAHKIINVHFILLLIIIVPLGTMCSKYLESRMFFLFNTVHHQKGTSCHWDRSVNYLILYVPLGLYIYPIGVDKVQKRIFWVYCPSDKLFHNNLFYSTVWYVAIC